VSVFAVLFASSSLCQNSDLAGTGESLPNALRGVSSPIKVTASGELADIGGKLIADAIEHAQFVLIGESHFSRETPRLAAAVVVAQPEMEKRRSPLV
jgi:hypothetical protein